MVEGTAGTGFINSAMVSGLQASVLADIATMVPVALVITGAVIGASLIWRFIYKAL